MATNVTTFKVKQSKERRPGPFDSAGGGQTLRSRVGHYVQNHLTRRNTSEDLICINTSVGTSNNIAVPVCIFCVLLISLFHSYRHCTRHSGQFLTLHQWPTVAQPLTCGHHELSAWSAVPLHCLDPASTHILYDVCQP